jgi:hypothetical protein
VFDYASHPRFGFVDIIGQIETDVRISTSLPFLHVKVQKTVRPVASAREGRLSRAQPMLQSRAAQ